MGESNEGGSGGRRLADSGAAANSAEQRCEKGFSHQRPSAISDLLPAAGWPGGRTGIGARRDLPYRYLPAVFRQ